MQTYLYLLVFLHLAEGCTFPDNKKMTIKASSGGSAVLPCPCADLLDKATNIIWRFRKAGTVDFNDIYPIDETDRYKDRVHLVHSDPPGNLTIRISHLTAEDEGTYQCVEKNQSINSRSVILTVKESFPFIHFAVVIMIFLQIIMAVVFCVTKNKAPVQVLYNTLDEDENVNLGL